MHRGELGAELRGIAVVQLGAFVQFGVALARRVRSDSSDTRKSPSRADEQQDVTGSVVTRPQFSRECASRENAEDAAQQPAVAEAHQAAAGRDPKKEQSAGGPLKQDRREVEAHLSPPR